MQEEEHIILKQIKKGDKAAFENIFKSNYSQMCSYANKFVNDLDEAEEIVQELFFQIWQKREDLNILISFKSYLFRSVHNSCLNQIKHKDIKQKHAEYSLNEQSSAPPDFSDAMDVNELQGRIRTAIDKLPPERRKVFLMIRYENLKYAEVAEQLKISVKTVENQMGSALKFMREELKDYLPVLIIIVFFIFILFQSGIGGTTPLIVY